MKNRAFGEIMDDADNLGFFKILRKADLSSEIMVIILILMFCRLMSFDLFVNGQNLLCFLFSCWIHV